MWLNHKRFFLFISVSWFTRIGPTPYDILKTTLIDLIDVLRSSCFPIIELFLYSGWFQTCDNFVRFMIEELTRLGKRCKMWTVSFWLWHCITLHGLPQQTFCTHLYIEILHQMKWEAGDYSLLRLYTQSILRKAIQSKEERMEDISKNMTTSWESNGENIVLWFRRGRVKAWTQ